MTIREMQFDFKMKYNSVDSQRDEDFEIPEMDWLLNEAQEVYVKMRANPKIGAEYGFEVNQRGIDDLRTIVIDQKKGVGQGVVAYDTGSVLAALPPDYWFHLNSKVYASKDGCEDRRLFTKEIQHDDEQDMSPFDRSSFRWRVANIRFNDGGIRIFNNNGEFIVNELCIEYLKKPVEMHNAADWIGGTYNKLDGTVLTGRADCKLPSNTHREIVDLAVVIAANGKSSPYYNVKMNKMSFAR